MTGQPTAAEVLRSHDVCRWSGSSYAPGWTCGVRAPYRETIAQHQADALAAAGLLLTPEAVAGLLLAMSGAFEVPALAEHDAQVAARALREATRFGPVPCTTCRGIRLKEVMPDAAP